MIECGFHDQDPARQAGTYNIITPTALDKYPPPFSRIEPGHCCLHRMVIWAGSRVAGSD